MRTKVTLVLLFLNVALFFFIFGFEREWRIQEQAEQARRRVLGPEVSNIHSIEITGAGVAETIKLRRLPEGWTLTEPIEWPANPHAVNRIVNELQFLEHVTSFAVSDLIDAGRSLADYGLEDPAITVTFSAGTLTGVADQPVLPPVSLAIGAPTAANNRLYILSPDRTRVHVVNRSLADSLRVSLEQLRAPTCFTIHVFEVRSLNLQTAGPANVRVRLRREGNRWSFEAPINARASKNATELALADLNSLQPEEFLGSGRARPELVTLAGTANPTMRVTLEGNNQRETLLLGNRVPAPAPSPSGVVVADTEPPEPRFYAQVEDRDAVFIVAVPESLLETLRGAQEKLRDPRVLPLEGREVTAITLETPNNPSLPPLTLQRLEPAEGAGNGAPGWQIVRTSGPGPQTSPAEREAVERLLQNLAVLSAEEASKPGEPPGFLRDVPSDAELEDWGLTRPTRRITLTLAPDPSNPLAPNTLTLLLGVGTQRESRVYAKLVSQTFVYLVTPDILRATPVVPRAYRDRLLRALPETARLAGLRLTDLATGEVLYARTLAEGETWENILPNETPERRDAIVALRAHLRTLRAQRFVLDAFADTVPVQEEDRPWAYRLDATFALTTGPAEQQTTTTLFFAPRTGGATQLVGSPTEEFNVVFEAEQPLLDALWVLTYGPRDPGPPAVPPPAPPATAQPE